MNNHLPTRLVLLGLTLGAAGLAAAGTPATSRSCFWSNSIRNFASIDNRTVYLRANGQDVYELKLFAPCLGVSWGRNVSLRTRGSSSICEGAGHRLEIVTRSPSRGNQRCVVTTVRKLTEGEIADLPSRARP
jgi:hypothetical protein